MLRKKWWWVGRRGKWYEVAVQCSMAITREALSARPMHVRLKRERDRAVRSDDEEDVCRHGVCEGFDYFSPTYPTHRFLTGTGTGGLFAYRQTDQLQC